MAKLYYRFGAMGSSKTAQALMTKFNYEEKGKTVWLIKPASDNRDDFADESGRVKTVARSRIGLYAEAEAVSASENLFERIETAQKRPDAIICDECQFLTEEQVSQLKCITDDFDIPVLCFGLRSDFLTKLFPGSRRLFELADSIAEIKSICECGKKATVNARIDGAGNIVTEGAQVLIGGNESYQGMCYKCYRKKIAEQNR